MIDIENASTAAGALLDAYPQKTTGTDNQLWKFVSDPAGSGYCFIQSKLNGSVIDIEGASINPGTPLDVSPPKLTGYDNQLWALVGGSNIQTNGSDCASLTGQEAELTASDGAAFDYLGASVAVSDNTAVIGTLRHTVGSNQHQGAAYVFVPDFGNTCATDATASVTISQGGFRLNHATNEFTETVTIQNASAVAVVGPISLVLDNLSSNATLANGAGITACNTPFSPYVNLICGPRWIARAGRFDHRDADIRGSFRYRDNVFGASSSRIRREMNFGGNVQRLLTMTLGMFLIAAFCRADAIYDVSLNTSPLVGNANGPFALDFQLTSGNSTSGIFATMMLSNFSFGAGGNAGAGSPFGNSGNVSGDLSSSVVLSTNGGSFFNEFSQYFTPGSLLTFQLDLLTTRSQPTGPPDEFTFQLIDNTLGEISTTDPSGSNSLMVIDLTNSNVPTFVQLPLTAQIYTTNGDGIAITPVFPSSTPAVPEPSSFLVPGGGAGNAVAEAFGTG